MAPNPDPSGNFCKYRDADAVSLALSAVKETTGQAQITVDKALSDLSNIIRDLERRESASESDVAVLKAMLSEVKGNSIERFTAQREAVSLALAAAKETTQIAQATADRAVAKAEAAAGKEYLESQIEGLRSSFSAQIIAQKEAINAALVAAKDALTAALASAEKAIAKAEEATNKRFDSVNEFRKTLTDQTASFIPRNEYAVQDKAISERLSALEKSKSEGFGRTTATTEARTDNRASFNVAIAAVVASVVLLSAIASVVTFVVTRPAPAVTYLPAVTPNPAR